MNNMTARGNLRKMKTKLDNSLAQYTLLLDGDEVNMNERLGKEVYFYFQNQINCVKCGRKTKKSFNSGYCYPCFRDAPENSPCVVSPEKCRAHLGEGRDMEWEKENHLTDQYVYLSLTSSVKVGVTRKNQIPVRWIDQGAEKGILLAKTPNRYEAGVIEAELKKHMSDKTSWQRMLKNESPENIDLNEEKKRVLDLFPSSSKKYFLEDENDVTHIEYPHLEVPAKVKSKKFDKFPEIGGVLTGIKGQYLIFDNQNVLNIRSMAGYLVEIKSAE